MKPLLFVYAAKLRWAECLGIGRRATVRAHGVRLRPQGVNLTTRKSSRPPALVPISRRRICAVTAMTPRNPFPTVDIIIELADRPGRPILLIERLNEPHGWAIPGGFVDYGESVEQAAVRESKEEVGLDVKLKEQFHVYSDPKRDPRKHTLSIVFVAEATGEAKAGDDAKNVAIHAVDRLPSPLCFDHGQILKDYCHYRETGKRPGI